MMSVWHPQSKCIGIETQHNDNTNGDVYLRITRMLLDLIVRLKTDILNFENTHYNYNYLINK